MILKPLFEHKFISMIALLPKYVLLKLLRDWLYLVEIGKLDSALCNHKSRPLFRLLFNNCELNFCHKLANSSKVNLVLWIVSRKIHVSSLFLKEESMGKPNIVDLLKNHSFTSLKHLKVACGPGYKSFNALIARAANLESLDIINAKSIGISTIRPMLNVCSQNLKSLTLTGIDITIWTLDIISSLAGSFLNLVNFNLIYCIISSESMNRMLNEFYFDNICSKFLKFTLQNYILAAEKRKDTSVIDIFLYYIHKGSSFEPEELRYVPLNDVGDKVIVWEKRKSECGTKYTNIVTATNKNPHHISNMSIASTIKTFVLDGYNHLKYVICRRQITRMYIKNCVIEYNTWKDCWFHYCKELVELNIHDSRIIVGFRCPTTNIVSLLPALGRVFIADSTFHIAALWLGVFAKTATALLKQVTITVPEAEMQGTFTSVLTERLAVLGTNKCDAHCSDLKWGVSFLFVRAHDVVRFG